MQILEFRIWHCQNRNCGASLTASSAELRDPGPRCICGSRMRHLEDSMGFEYLNFLRNEGQPIKRREEE
jgi:hypothetical protein